MERRGLVEEVRRRGEEGRWGGREEERWKRGKGEE